MEDGVQTEMFDLPAASPRVPWDQRMAEVVHDDRRVHGFFGPYRWLSNFHPCSVCHDGRTFLSSEGAYQAAKFPVQHRDEFTKLDGKAAKKRSVELKHLKATDWNERSLVIMKEVVRAKFSQNPELTERLVATGERELVEINWWNDRFYGVCRGAGENHLGKLLMEERGWLTKDRAKRIA